MQIDQNMSSDVSSVSTSVKIKEKSSPKRDSSNNLTIVDDKITTALQKRVSQDILNVTKFHQSIVDGKSPMRKFPSNDPDLKNFTPNLSRDKMIIIS